MSRFAAKGLLIACAWVQALLIACAWVQAYAGRPAHSTAVSEPSSKVDSLAYRIFDGLHMMLHFCQPPSSEVLDGLSWSDVTVPLPWLMDDKTLTHTYAFVPGDFFDVHVRTDAGFCYKSKKQGRHVFMVGVCVCGNLTLANSPTALDEKVDGKMDFTGCDDFAQSGPSVSDPPVEVFFSGEAKANVTWSHPASLWIQVQRGGEEGGGQWCETKAALPDKVDNSISHGLPYCVVANKIETEVSLRLDSVKAHFYWAMCFDQKHPSNWFKADTMKYQDSWKGLCGLFPQNWNGSVRDILTRDSDRMKEISESAVELCRVLRLGKPKMFDELSRVYDTYMKGLPLAKNSASQASGVSPLVLFATGPPSSGKSLTSMSNIDFDLINNKTTSSMDDFYAFKGRRFEDLQTNTLEINLDRILESTDLLQSQKLHSSTFVRWTEHTNTGADSDALLEAQRRSQEDGQRDYWFLRKGAGLDDLSNAHTQLLLGLGKDVIYETLFNSPRWILDFDIPKMKAAGYVTVAVNYVVPVSELVQRAFDREKATGQTPAPAQQIEADAKASPTNFMKPEFLRQINYGVSLSHVRKGEVEDALAVYRNPPGGKTVGCFSYCAADDMMENYNMWEMKKCKYAKCEEQELSERKDPVANSKPSFLLEAAARATPRAAPWRFD